MTQPVLDSVGIGDDGKVTLTFRRPTLVPPYMPPIPAFLRRTERLTDDQIRQLTRGHESRVWVMPDMRKYAKPETTIDEDQTMAKAEFLIENRAASIVVYAYPVGSDTKPFHVFPDADAFEAWYRPGKVRFCGQNTGTDFTDVLLDIPPGTPSPSAAFPVRRAGTSTGVPSTGGRPPLPWGVSPHTPTEKATGGREKAPGKVPGKVPGKPVKEGQRYIDSRHVALMEAAGLVNLGTWPMTFLYKHTTIDFDPPPEGRRWATTWSFKGAAGRGVSTLLVALGIKEPKT